MAGLLPQFQSDDKDFQLMQNAWAARINPLLKNPANNSLILKEVILTTGSNIVNHLLGRKLQGWAIIRKRAAAEIYDTQDANSMPELTLTLTSSANVTVDLMVF